jgi:hypothetical protein
MKRKSVKANHGKMADSDPRPAQPGADGRLPTRAVPHEGAPPRVSAPTLPRSRGETTPVVHGEGCEPDSGKGIRDPGPGPGDPSGPVLRGVTWESDISDPRRFVEELALARRLADQRAAELEAVLSAVPAAVWIAHDADCRHITGNRTADDWLRLPSGAESSLTARAGSGPPTLRSGGTGATCRARSCRCSRRPGGSRCMIARWRSCSPTAGSAPSLATPPPCVMPRVAPAGVSPPLSISPSANRWKRRCATKSNSNATTSTRCRASSWPWRDRPRLVVFLVPHLEANQPPPQVHAIPGKIPGLPRRSPVASMRRR